jgi:hypothetical protein
MNVSNGSAQAIVALDKAYAAKIGGGTIAGLQELHLLDDGAIAFFTQHGVLIPLLAVAADISSITHVWVAQGMPDNTNNLRRTVLMERAAYWVNTQAGVAADAQVSAVGLSGTGSLNLPGTLLNGTYATITIVNKTEGDIRPGSLKRYEVPVVSTDTATTIINKLVAAINADTERIVTAANTGPNTGISLTALDVNTVFRVGVDGVLANATVHEFGITGTTDGPEQGRGTPDQVRRLVAETAISDGDSLRGEGFRYSSVAAGWWNVVESTIPSDALFTITTIQWKSENQAAGDVVQIGMPLVYICVLEGGAEADEIGTLLEEIFSLPLSVEAGVGAVYVEAN